MFMSNLFFVLETSDNINEIDIVDVFESIYTKVISNIQKCVEINTGGIIDSVVDHNIYISKYKKVSGSSCIKLPKELDSKVKLDYYSKY